MKVAYDSGVNFFDCAEVYAEGESERVMGEAKKYGRKRSDLVIATNVCQHIFNGAKTDRELSQLYWGTASSDKKISIVGLSRKYIIEGIEASLERLQLSYVDLVFAHHPDRQTPMEETVRAFNHLIKTGKALYWGTSEWGPDEIAHAWRYADKPGLIGPLMGMFSTTSFSGYVLTLAGLQSKRGTTCWSATKLSTILHTSTMSMVLA
jgi:aryl-alcohol dehydrogenase-like predicted oxidoreductase